MFKKSLLAAAAALVLPVAANAQSGTAYPGFYIGAEGGANWLLNNNSYQMDTGWAAGGKLGYDFVGPRVELEGLYRSNTGTGNVLFPGGVANVRGRIDQVSVMANLLYDFMPTSAFTPFIGAGAGIAFVDSTIQGCNLCSTQFAYQGIIGVAWNITEAFRLSVDGRYYGTTNPGRLHQQQHHDHAELELQVRPARDGRRRRRRRRRWRRRRSWCSSTGIAPTSPTRR